MSALLQVSRLAAGFTGIAYGTYRQGYLTDLVAKRHVAHGDAHAPAHGPSPAGVHLRLSSILLFALILAL
jgi:hypothetical protein